MSQGDEERFGVVRPIKSIMSHCCGVHSKTINAPLAGLLQTGRCHINFPPPVKNPPLRCDHLSKFFDR